MEIGSFLWAFLLNTFNWLLPQLFANTDQAWLCVPFGTFCLALAIFWPHRFMATFHLWPPMASPPSHQWMFQPDLWMRTRTFQLAPPNLSGISIQPHCWLMTLLNLWARNNGLTSRHWPMPPAASTIWLWTVHWCLANNDSYLLSWCPSSYSSCWCVALWLCKALLVTNISSVDCTATRTRSTTPSNNIQVWVQHQYSQWLKSILGTITPM